MHRFQGHGTPGDQIVVGDIVIVHSDERKRGFWNLGRVEELIKGSDGQQQSFVFLLEREKLRYFVVLYNVYFLWKLMTVDNIMLRERSPQLTIQMRWRRLQNMNHNPQKKWYALERSNSLRNCGHPQG